MPASPVPSPSPAGAEPGLGSPFAVMIDNSPDGRPHSGLAAADVIYGAPAEAGIPRFLAVFLREEAPRIGPVRSARHYYVQLAAEWGVPLVHIGASPQGFEALAELGVERVDEARGDGGFNRDRQRPAPYDAYVSSASVAEELGKRGVKVAPRTTGVVFGNAEAGPRPATHLRLAYPCCIGYDAEFAYDPATRLYAHTMDGDPDVDEKTGERYAARSLIVQQVNVEPIPGDTAGRVDVSLIGSGTGLLLVDGTQVGLRWSKDGPQSPTRFEREDGLPFALPRGQVWIELVPPGTNVEVR